MLKIRLARGGAKKRPYYYIVVADSHAPRDGKFIERVGSYNPLVAKDSPERIKLNAERISEWLGKGAQPTDRVVRFLAAADIRPWTHDNNPNKGKPGKKAEERAAERAQRETDRAEAEAAARAEAAAAPAVDETPAADTSTADEAPSDVETPTEDTPAEAETEAQPS